MLALLGMCILVQQSLASGTQHLEFESTTCVAIALAKGQGEAVSSAVAQEPSGD